MKLFEISEKLPKGRPNWETIAEKSSGELLPLGVAPRLTMGERILGRYKKFYQVDMNEKTMPTEFEARSETGRHSFTIRLETDFRVADALAVVSGKDDVMQHLITPMKRMATQEASFFSAHDYHALEFKLTDILDPSRVGESRRGPFEILAVAVQVDAPKGVKLIGDSEEEIFNLDMRIAEALAKNDPAGAEAMKEAKKFIVELREQEEDAALDTVLRKADKLAMVERKILDMKHSGSSRESDAIKALQEVARKYVAGDGDKQEPEVEERKEQEIENRQKRDEPPADTD